MKKLLLLSITLLALVGCSSDEQIGEMIANGKLLYAENCASCHGGSLEGQSNWNKDVDKDGHRLAPPLNGTGHSWHHSPNQLFQMIKYGLDIIDPNYEGKMIGNENLTDEEILSILEYIKSVWPENLKKEYETIHK
jgi:mono/diheme cytochrome c family protein